MKTIELTQGKVALVDDADYLYLNQFKWHAHLHYSGRIWYAIRGTVRDDGRKTTIPMHRVIMKARPDEQVDHIDHDGLNNQRINLRLCTVSQNAGNSNKHKHSRNPYKGVHLTDSGRYRAYITINSRRINLGRFDDPIEAAEAYDAKAREVFGEFALTNFKRE